MKIDQEEVPFNPIKITLETKEEVYALWDVLEGRVPEHIQKQKLDEFCDWLSNKAQL